MFRYVTKMFVKSFKINAEMFGVQAKPRPAKVRPSHYCQDGFLPVPLWSHFRHLAWAKVRPI